MIVVSLLLILVAVALLVLGLGAGSSAFLISSIVASLLAAVALVIGARRAAHRRASAIVADEPRRADFDLDRDAADRPDAFPSPPPPARAAPAVPDFAAADVPDLGTAPAAEASKPDTFAAAPASFAEPGEAQSGAGVSGSGEVGADEDADPADEPPPQAIRPADAVRIARLTTDVFVVDGRPRYHLAECSHLSGRHAEALPADEAMELGFTPCDLCRPVDHLVAESARR